MRREGSYGNSDEDTDVVTGANLSATDPDWLIEHDPNLAPLTDADYEAFEAAVSEGLRDRAR